MARLVVLAALLLPVPAGAQIFLDVNPDWSPDGSRIVFESRRGPDADLWILGPDGSFRRLKRERGDETHPDWSPDGARLVFDALRDSTWNLWVLDLRTGGLERLTDGPTGTGAYARHPAWSPDGSTIAFDSERDGNLEIYALDLRSGVSRRLTTDPAADTHPEWSPDGRTIAFSSDRGSEAHDLWLMGADGSSPRWLVGRPGGDGGAAWSPDGGRIAFFSEGEPNAGIWIVDVAEGEARPLVSDGSTWYEVSWSPDGRLAGYSDAAGRFHLYAIDAGSGATERLTW